MIIRPEIGVKLLYGSYGSLLYRLGLAMKVESGAMNRVWPSAGELTTNSAAIWLLAPGLFSPTPWAPQALPKRSANARPMISVTPPAGAGDTMVMVLLGKVSAQAGAVATSAPNASNAAMSFFMSAFLHGGASHVSA